MNGGSPFDSRLDTTLLEGLEFACRPDCGLCCYATPAVDRAERAELLQIAPESTFIADARGRAYIPARPQGGACQFLAQSRCSVHAARPFPCAVFPVIVHAGTRFQASAVLSCPGVSIPGAVDPGGVRALGPPRGLETELGRAEARCRSEEGRRALAAARRDGQRVERILEREGLWVPTLQVRASLRGRIPLPDSSDFPVEDPPELEEGEEVLPLFFDDRRGPVAIAGHAGGWQLVELQEAGGIRAWRGVWPPPTRMPRLDAGAERALREYLAYWLERDALFGFVHAAMLEEPSGEDVLIRITRELRWIGATTVARARVRASGRGASAPVLAEPDIARGIRASDADLLDRAGWTVQL
ncbi:MAG: YkgJ family cysteine cluster protein [Thermoplasmata archaeon]|nr:YkgJ family cysteine cluster protein [Thermoplasmata archaeon]